MDEFAIRVEDVSKTFKLPHEKSSSIKSAIINFHKGGRSYEKQQVLKHISFEIKKGEFVGIVGRNGSGKSTLLKLMAGIYSPTTGVIHVRGKLTPFIELGVGFNPELTGRENVFLNGALLGFTRSEMEAMYDDIVAFAEIKRFMDQKLKNYSSGMQVRLAFSIAIRAKGDILLIDEVLAVGDAAFQQKCFNYFEELKAQNKTVIFVTHDMGAVRRFCTKAIYIKNGKLMLEGNPSDIADVYAQDNIDRSQKAQAAEKEAPSPSKIRTSIATQHEHDVVLKLSYETAEPDPVYIGMSILRDGISVAEITTPADLELGDKGELTYTLDTRILNGGMYQVTAVLCRKRNREMIAGTKNKSSFVIKGSDPTKGAAIKLGHAWNS